jgi:hypothetical protein
LIAASPHRGQLAATLALAFSLIALLTLLLLPAPAPAQTHKTSCSTSSTHPKRGAHACRKPARKVTAHVRHAKKQKRSSRSHAKTLPGSKAPGSASLIPASCEDGSEPVRKANGSRACADGSEASCEDGSDPRTGAGGILLCHAPAATSGAGECEDGTATPCPAGGEGSAETTPAGCEDGSAALATGSGTYACRGDVGPSCLEGSSPSFSSDGLSFVCERES